MMTVPVLWPKELLIAALFVVEGRVLAPKTFLLYVNRFK